MLISMMKMMKFNKLIFSKIIVEIKFRNKTIKNKKRKKIKRKKIRKNLQLKKMTLFNHWYNIKVNFRKMIYRLIPKFIK